jgi:hypothetical protein
MGTYISTLPVFVFSYAYTISDYDYQDLWLKVIDLTNGEDLFFETLQSGSFDLYIYTPLGHEINVELSTYARSYDEGYGYSSSSFSFVYETAVVSEPPPCFDPVRNARTSVYYTSIQDAYDEAENADTIESQAQVFTESLYIDDLSDKSVSIIGGYDCTYSVITGDTTLIGDIIISNGTVTFENFIME